MLTVWRKVDSDPHILIFPQITFHTAWRIERFNNRNSLFFNRFNGRRKLFGVSNSREQGKKNYLF